MMNQSVESFSSLNLLDKYRPTVIKQEFKDLYTNYFNDVLCLWKELSDEECANYLLLILKVSFITRRHDDGMLSTKKSSSLIYH